VGEAVDFLVGLFEGLVVDESVGLGVGASVGVLVTGLMEGEDVGVEVGLAVGKGVEGILLMVGEPVGVGESSITM